MSNFSLVGSGIVVGALSLFLSWAGVPVVDGQLESFVDTALKVISAVMILWGQYRRKDLVGGMFRKA